MDWAAVGWSTNYAVAARGSQELYTHFENRRKFYLKRWDSFRTE